MTLSQISIKNSVFAWMLMIGLILFGYISFRQMGISQLPDVDFPVINVQITYEGSAPETIETNVVDVVEDVLMSVEGIKTISSASRQGQADITIELELGRDINAAIQEVQTKLSQAQKLLPREIDPPIITKTNPEDFPILWVSLSAEGVPPRKIMEFARDRLKDQLQTVQGVGDILLSGYIEPNLRIWLHPDKLNRYELTSKDIVDALARQHIEVPAGRVETNTQEINLRSMGEVFSKEDMENILIDRRGGVTIFRPIRLKEVADVELGLADIRRISRTNGVPSIALGIRKQRGSNAVEVADGIQKKLDVVQKVFANRHPLQVDNPLDLPLKTLISTQWKNPRSLAEHVFNQVENRFKMAVFLTSLGVIQEKGHAYQPNPYSKYKLQVNYDTTRFIRQSTDEMKHHLVLAALLTAVVCLLFLASFSATFNVLLAIPTSIVGAFTVLHFAGFTLNTFTLLGLTLAIGIVVDDAIMVLENIVRHREMGKSAIRAALDGSREITSAAIAATLAIIAVFAPVIFMKGIIGKYFFQFGVTLSVTVAISLIEALTLTPMRASRIGSAHQPGFFSRLVDYIFGFFIRAYAESLRICLKLKWIVLILAFALFGYSFSLLPKLNKELVPSQDQSSFILDIRVPLGSSIIYTDEKMKQVENLVKAHPVVARYFTAIGGFAGGEVNSANMFVTLKEPEDRPVNPKTGKRYTQGDVMKELRGEAAKIPEVRPTVRDLSLRGFATSNSPVEFTVRGPDYDKLIQYSEAIVGKMRENEKSQQPLFADTRNDFQSGQKEIQIYPIREAAYQYGVSLEDLGQTISVLMGGARSGKFTENGRRNDIRFRLVESYRQTQEDIKKLYVRNNRGELVSLSKLVTLEEKDSLNKITREGRERAIKITANMAPGQSQERALSEVENIARNTLPDTGEYRVVFSGSAQALQESFQSLVFVLILGIAVAYMVLASQYNSFIHPITVLLALPFSLSGAWVALWMFQGSLNIYSFIGVILLMGIAKKNSILLVDFTNQKREEGLSMQEALIAACPQRLRPILMTSLATIAAAIPSAVSTGPGSETRIPMALVLLGGIAVSTVLTLFVIPCAYAVLSRFELKKKKIEEDSHNHPGAGLLRPAESLPAN